MLIDIDPSPRNSYAWLCRQIPLFIAAAVFAYAAWLLFGLLFASTEFPKEYAVLGTIAFLCLEFAIVNAMEKARLHRLVNQCELSNVQTDLAKLLTNTSFEDKRFILRRYLRKLVDAGSRECVIRLRPLIPDDSLCPFLMPFEPHPFGDLSLQEQFEINRPSVASNSILQPLAKHVRTARSKRNIYVSTCLFFLVWSILCGIIWYYRGAAITLKILWPFLAFVASFNGLWILLLIMPSKQWFLVPAGLVVRTTGWLRKRATIHLFERRNCVLAVLRRNPNRWSLIVANRAQVESLGATPDQARQFLRAWLSPLDSPTIEQLSELI